MNIAKEAILKNQDCKCNVHPSFLLGKSNFNCQEEQYINVTKLKRILNYSQSLNNGFDISTKNLKNYLEKNDKKSIRFDKYYSFYVNQENYNSQLNNIISAQNSNDELNFDDCGWWCVLGCGSDYGCCGNYSGCCLFWSINCLIHDSLCSNCEPNWFCLPGCIEDTRYYK